MRLAKLSRLDTPFGSSNAVAPSGSQGMYFSPYFFPVNYFAIGYFDALVVPGGGGGSSSTPTTIGDIVPTPDDSLIIV